VNLHSTRRVLIFRHVSCEGPGYLGEFLSRHGIPWQIIKIDEGEEVPASVEGASGLVFMGGPMSVNDDLPWITAELELIRLAHERALPVLGHCLGAQLISKSLGGRVVSNRVTEIGWFPLQAAEPGSNLVWMKKLSFATECFHWHGETFTLPDRAIPLFKSHYCANQGFVTENILALQCHIEMQADMVRQWLSYYQDAMPAPSISVQTPAEMLNHIEHRIASLHAFADTIYYGMVERF
jgi:GMP synthase - Glutamine amidotransferase domain